MAISVRVRIPFRDLTDDREREIGEEFACSEKRADYLQECGLVWKLGHLKEPAKPRAASASKKPQAKAKPAPKTTKTTKAAAKK